MSNKGTCRALESDSASGTSAEPAPALGDNPCKPLGRLRAKRTWSIPCGSRAEIDAAFSLSLYWSNGGRPLLLTKESDELRRFRRAGVPGNDVNVIRIFIERFSGL